MGEVSKSQKYRQIKVLKSKMDKALWFADSYGLRPTSVRLESSNGESVHVPLGSQDNSVDVEKMKEILFILDKFKIGDEAYHEIVRKSDDLPKLHSIVRLREEKNTAFEIHRTPGNIPGAYVSLKSELINILKTQEVTNRENTNQNFRRWYKNHTNFSFHSNIPLSFVVTKNVSRGTKS